MKVKAPRKRRCKVCGRVFQPKPLAWRQEVCSRERCQKIRKSRYFQDWKKKNPDYYKIRGKESFISSGWKERAALFRKNNPDYIKRWRKKNKKRWRKYMRDYMRKYRSKT